MGALPKRQWDKQINSIDLVIEAIEYLNLPRPDRSAIISISGSSEKAKFRTALEECLQINGAQPSDETKRYLVGLVHCISPTVIQVVNQLGYKNIPIELMVEIGLSHGMPFRSAIKSAIQPNAPDYEEKKSFVQHTITEVANSMGIEINLPKANAQERPAVGASASPKLVQTQSQQNEPNEPPPSYQEEELVKEKDFMTAHVYGGKAALCFNAGLSKKKTHVITVDAATSIGEKTYDWDKAITIQLGHKELPLLFGVFAGWRNGIKFSAHGAANDKALEIARQEGKFYVTVQAKGEAGRAVQITEMDAYYVYCVILRQIMRQAPEEFRDKPEIVIQMMKQTQNIKPV